MIVAEDEPAGNIARLPALMRDAGVIDDMEPAAFHHDIACSIPEFDGVAETNVQIMVPHRSADEGEFAVAYGDILHMAILIAMHAAVAEAEILEHEMALTADEFAMPPQNILDFMPVPPGIRQPGIKGVDVVCEGKQNHNR